MAIPKRYYIVEELFAGIPDGYRIVSGDGMYQSKSYSYTLENKEYLEKLVWGLNVEYREKFGNRYN